MAAPERAMSHRGLSDPSIIRVRAVIEAGLATLESRREEVNALNRGGAADGDTGDNMVLTMRAVLEELDRLAGASEGRTIDEIGRGEIVASVARAALLGARGSSGVILSQLIRGAAEELASRPGELIDPVLVGAALARAADQAYGSVREPAEGTMLTVVRELAHRVASEVAHRPEARLAPETTALEQDLAIASVIESAMRAGADVVGSSPLGQDADRLRDAVSRDAGGHGLVVLMAGIVGALRGAASDAPRRGDALPAREGAAHTSITYRWCTSFAVSGDGLAARSFASALESIGDAVLVVGDASTLKIHLHTDDPDAATALFADAGVVSHLEVVDMYPSG
jgi:dihydroxyacetone kinase-like predicted kinase